MAWRRDNRAPDDDRRTTEIGPSLRSTTNGLAIPHLSNPVAVAGPAPGGERTQTRWRPARPRIRDCRICHCRSRRPVRRPRFARCRSRARPAENVPAARWAPGANRRKASRTMRPSSVNVSVRHLAFTALPSTNGTRSNSSGNASARRDIDHASPERLSANAAKALSTCANKLGQLLAPKNILGPTTSSLTCRTCINRQSSRPSFALVEPR